MRTVALALLLLACGDDLPDTIGPTPDPGDDTAISDTAGEDTAVDDTGGDDTGPVDTGDTGPTQDVVTIVYDFETGLQGWEAGFTDLPADPDPALYELDSGLAFLPEPLPVRRAVFVQSHNRSDDVWMFLARRLGPEQGLLPDTTYVVTFDIAFATQAPEGCFGIGGPPAESVYLKVGASAEPAVILVEDDRRIFSLDKGNQSQPGSESTSAGHIGSGLECPDDTWVLVEREVTHRFPVTTTAEGELTVFLGTDSGFEGLTRLYYDRIGLELEATNP